MSARFRVLRKPIHLDAIKTKKVVLACCVVHNYLISTNKSQYAPVTAFDQYDNSGNIISPADWRTDDSMIQLQTTRHRNDAIDGKEMQKEFASYFVDEGDISWQYDHI